MFRMEEVRSNVEDSSSAIKTVDGGRAVEIPDEVWARATQMDYIEGWPIYARRP